MRLKCSLRLPVKRNWYKVIAYTPINLIPLLALPEAVF